MIEKTVIDYLNTKLDVTAYPQIPDRNIPASFVLVEKTGSSEKNYIETATIAIQSYAARIYDAMLLNEDVKSAMRDITAFTGVSHCGLVSDYNYSDAEKKKYRYQAVFQLAFVREEN